MAKKNKPEKGFYENGIYYKEMADLSASVSVTEKEAQTELDELKGEIQALKGELRLKNEEIEDLYRIIGEMYVENKSRQPLL